MQQVRLEDIPEEERKWLDREKEKGEKDCTENKDRGVLKVVTRRSPDSDHENPKYETKVRVNYVAKFPNGKIYDDREGYEFVIGDEEGMYGIELAVLQMRKGERADVTISKEYTMIENITAPLKQGLVVDIVLVEFWKEKGLWDMTIKERFDSLVKRKEEGNQLFAQKKYFRATRKYTRGLEFIENEQNFSEEEKKNAPSARLPCHLNCALSMLKTGKCRGAIEHCNKALVIDPNNVKAIFRKGCAFSTLDEWTEAEENFNKVLQLEPDNKDAKLELSKIKRRMVETSKKDKQTYAGLFEKLAQNREDSSEEEEEEEEQNGKAEIKEQENKPMDITENKESPFPMDSSKTETPTQG